MARAEYNSVFIASDDFWAFDADSFSDSTNFYGKAWVVPAAKVGTLEEAQEKGYQRCQLFYQVGKRDDQLFTPTTIVYDDERDVVMISGEQGRIGQESKTSTKRKIFAKGQLAQRFKNLTESEDSKDPARFMVNYIVVSNDEDNEDIKAFVEELNKTDDDNEESEAEEFYAEEDEDDTMAREMNAENLNRVNPTVVEGAEDIHGAEDMMGLPAADDGHVIGQDYDGLVVGQAAEEEDFGMVGEGNDFGQMRAEEEMLGTIGEGNDFGQMGAEEEMDFGMVGEGNDFGQMRAEAYDYSPDEYSPMDDPMDFDPTEMMAEDVVDFVQDLPLIRQFRLGGWTASALVVGIAALSGAYFAKRK
jgi:hypothetical protein